MQNAEELDNNDQVLTEVEVNTPFISDISWTGTRGNETTDPCIACHELAGVLDVITLDWKSSKHSQNSVSCIDRHKADPSDPDAESHNGYYITHVVSHADCANCHDQETQEFEQSQHSFGTLYYEYPLSIEKLPYIESQLEGGYIVVEGEDINHAATLRGCQSYHGTNMTGKSIQNFTVWPNNGIGRTKPNGSKGNCSACHSRHSFSIAETRHPQIEMIMESKHGNIYAAESDSWNWTADD